MGGIVVVGVQRQHLLPWALGREGWIELACEDCEGRVKACSRDSDISVTAFGASVIMCKKKL